MVVFGLESNPAIRLGIKGFSVFLCLSDTIKSELETDGPSNEIVACFDALIMLGIVAAAALSYRP
jgi:hypothetical protein